MKYQVKVQGTKYIAALELDHDQWYLRLKMNKVIEHEVSIEQLTIDNFQNALLDIFGESSLGINEFQIENIYDEIMKEAHQIFEKADPEGYSWDRDLNNAHEMETDLKDENTIQSKIAKSSPIQAQKTLISEYQSKLKGKEPLPIKNIDITELRTKVRASKQIDELIRSNEKTQAQMKELDERLSKLERLVMDLIKDKRVILGT